MSSDFKGFQLLYHVIRPAIVPPLCQIYMGCTEAAHNCFYTFNGSVSEARLE